MPELPEVETVCRGIELKRPALGAIEAVVVHRRDLRTLIPRDFESQLKGQKIFRVRRRAKYIIFDTDDYSVLSHLGMSGSWRFANGSERLKHDHCHIIFSNGEHLVFHDPRRFGLIDLCALGQDEGTKWFKHLGVEPLDSHFSVSHMLKLAQKRTTPIKTFLMDQKNVVGVGNIYASEALFLAKINPLCPAGKLSSTSWSDLIKSVKSTLRQAIRHGGTTLRDYRNSDGEVGAYQRELHVYGREGAACRSCKAKIRCVSLSGRATYWCKGCQK